MTKIEFIKKYYGYAKQAETVYKVPALFVLAQSAVETAWGEKAPGNMMFGIKDTDGINGNEQLITTTEFSKNPNANFKNIISKVWSDKYKQWKYTIKSYFRKYNTPKDSFVDHILFFLTNARYKDNWEKCGLDPYKWADEVAADGYATGPSYASLIKQIIKSLEQVVKDLGL